MTRNMSTSVQLEDLKSLERAWGRYAPTHTFSGYSLGKLQSFIVQLEELLEAMSNLRLEYRGSMARRDTLSTELRNVRRRIMNAIRGHEDFGENSEFYRALGFKTLAEINGTRHLEGLNGHHEENGAEESSESELEEGTSPEESQSFAE